MEKEVKDLQEQVDVLSRAMENLVRNSDAMLQVLAHHNFIQVNPAPKPEGEEAPEEVAEEEAKEDEPAEESAE